MTFVRTLAAAAILAASMTGIALAKDWKDVRIATEGAYPPFNSVAANGELVGFDVEIAKALCDKMAVKCSLVAQDWDGIIPALLAGKYDAIVASMSVTDERKKMIDFTDPYYRTPLSVVGPKSAAEDVSPAALKGKVLGAQSSTTQAVMAEEKYQPAGAEVKLYPTENDAHLDLAAGRLDAVIADKFLLLDWLKSDGAACCKILGDVPETNTPAAIALRQEDDDLREMFNKALAAIRADGTYDKIRSKYFAFDIY